MKKALIASLIVVLAAGGYAVAATIQVEEIPVAIPYTGTTTMTVKGKPTVVVYSGVARTTVQDTDTVPDPVTVTEPGQTVTVTVTGETTTAPPTTTTSPPPPGPTPGLQAVEPNPSSLVGSFPIGTWGSYNTTQANRDLDAAAGINTYVWLADPCGLGQQALADPRFSVIYEQSENRSCVGSSAGWVLGDEVDMCCGPPDFAGGNGYQMLTDRNNSLPADGRFRYTNYGKGVMFWETDQQAAQFVNLPFLGVVSNDIYWFTDPNERSKPGYRVASSYGDTVARMRMLDAMDGKTKPIWNFVETGWPFTESAAAGGRSITGPELRAAAWHSIIAGARGIIWFQHSFGGPCVGDHHTVRSNCEGTRAAVVGVGAQINAVAPALNGPTLTSGYTATGAVRSLAKWDGSNFYVFAGSAGNAGTQASFSIPCVGDATATVVGENRTVAVQGGAWTDSFADGLSVHIYRVDGGSKCGL